MNLPKVWNDGGADYIFSKLKHDASRLFRIHQLPDSLEEWEVSKNLLRKNIWRSLGVTIDHSLELDYNETKTIEMEGYLVKNIFYQSRPGLYVTGNLYIPDGEGPFPGVICMHGHWEQGKLAERVQARGHTLSKNGYVCLVVDAFGSGERSTVHGEYEYHGGMLGASLMNIGETLMGAQVVDNMRGVDLLSSMDFVDSSKIGATGASGGGNQTMWLGALDERVAAVVPVVSVGTFESYICGNNCVCELLPDGLTFTEESGVLALIAPRALKICNCLKDSNPTFYPSEMLRSLTETRKVFRSYQADENLSYQIFNLPHGYWPEIREAMLGWFDFHLKGIGHGAPKEETAFESLPEEELMVFRKGKRDKKVISIAEYCIAEGTSLKESLQTRNHVDDEKKKKSELALILRIGKALELKDVHNYSPKSGWERHALETTCGRMIPLLLKKPSGKSSEYLVLADSVGKEELIKTTIFKDAVASEKGIAIIDLWGCGETVEEESFKVAKYHTLSRAVLWLGRSLMGEWVRDYTFTVQYLEKQLDAEKITVAGTREAGLASLFCSVLSEKQLPVITEKSPVSFIFRNQEPFEREKDSLSMALHIPGILKWGDVELATTLTRADVRFIAPVFSDGTLLSQQEKDDFSVAEK